MRQKIIIIFNRLFCGHWASSSWKIYIFIVFKSNFQSILPAACIWDGKCAYVSSCKTAMSELYENSFWSKYHRNLLCIFTFWRKKKSASRLKDKFIKITLNGIAPCIQYLRNKLRSGIITNKNCNVWGGQSNAKLLHVSQKNEIFIQTYAITINTMRFFDRRNKEHSDRLITAIIWNLLAFVIESFFNF